MTLAGIVSSASRNAQAGALTLIPTDRLGSFATSSLDVGTFAALANTISVEGHALQNSVLSPPESRL